ncbi:MULTISPECIES: energy transducer TonB [unclassified Beijerinckia]|uniref:energy transducer TonB n=1 Tax=unclassified Beijerinckia TaxID=2638183 RepID=UPI000896B508|nr:MULTISPECIES: energy transducer TonB [unclassified Beijerinckia]MDH7796020.1 protein TonB [Beijerinckia sp. GAS462]SEC26676.1 protein TonB [Beijerinckia sp. 28-YEA-48]
MKRMLIGYAFAASLALHSVLALPFVVQSPVERLPDELPTLAIELQGAVSDQQVEERTEQQAPKPPQQRQQPPESQQQQQQQHAPPPEPPDEAGDKPPEPQPQTSARPEPQSVLTQAPPTDDPDEQQEARILQAERDREADRLREYIKRLTRKVQANLVYPSEGRRAGLQGNATVSFRLAPDGQIKPGTLVIAASSGQPKLDASALATARICAPFEPPPREMTVTLVVGYGRKK